MCIMGNVRVNFTNLQKVAACQRRVTIIAKYTTDDWVTSQETKAMIVKAQSHPALSHFTTKGKEINSRFEFQVKHLFTKYYLTCLTKYLFSPVTQCSGFFCATSLPMKIYSIR